MTQVLSSSRGMADNTARASGPSGTTRPPVLGHREARYSRPRVMYLAR